jgi:hypothetical protein
MKKGLLMMLTYTNKLGARKASRHIEFEGKTSIKI